MDFSKFFIDRPIFAIVLSVIMFAVGLIAIPQLPSGEYPEVVPPSVVVRATYPGANPKEIAESVAVPLEEAINGVEGLMYMKSVAASDGSLQVVSTFRPGTDPDAAAVRVQNRVSQAQSRLPEEVRQYGITTQKQSATPLMYVGLASKDGKLDTLYLRNYVTLKVKDELARLPGIGDVGVYGSGDYAMRIWLDPDKVAARQLTANQVIAAIREQNVQVSAGQLGAEPSTKGTDKLLSINVQGRLSNEQEFGDIVLKTGADGQVVRLADVARIELGASDYTLRAALDNQNMAAIGIFLTPGANALGVADEVYKTLDRLSASLPQGASFEYLWDPTVFVRDSIQAVQRTLIEAVILVVLVVIVFLQTWRASIIPLLAVPVSIVGTFAWLYLLGYSINTLTLFGLVLAIGIVVDDAIVVVENVERFIEKGHSPREAAHLAMKEVSGPIIAIALVLCAVFVPMAFLDGITGQFYKQFAVTIAISTVISAINSLTLSPALAAKLLQGHGARKDWLARGMDAGLGWFFQRFNRLFNRSASGYENIVGRSFKMRGVVFVVYVALLGGTAWLFNTVPGGFIPMQDKLYLFAGAKLPEGASLSRTDEVTRELTKHALSVEGVHSVPAFAGLNALQGTNTPNLTSAYVILKPFGERQRSAADISAELNGKLSGMDGGFGYALMPPPIQGLGNGSGYSLFLEDRAGLGYAALQQALGTFQAEIAKTPGM
ncbi:MAG: efflux RND transporter permease subunit, partial [Comamonas sp.]